MRFRMLAGRIAIAGGVMLAANVASPPPLRAQQDCAAARGDWSNIQLFRSCLARSGLNAWAITPTGRSILHDAALETGNPTIVALLLEAGSNPNARDDEGSTALYLGVWNENPMVTAHLLGAGADPNAANNLGYAPLHIASTRNNARAIQLLLDAGANPNALSNDGWTPLHNAAFFGARDAIPVLLDAGAGEDLTPLHRAILMANPGAVSAVLDAGADPDATDAHGWTALHYAVPMAGPEIVARLLGAGVEPDDGTANGLSALHLAGDGATVAALRARAPGSRPATTSAGRRCTRRACSGGRRWSRPCWRRGPMWRPWTATGSGRGILPRGTRGLRAAPCWGGWGAGDRALASARSRHPACGVIVRGRYLPRGGRDERL